jgi:hypothetical protein
LHRKEGERIEILTDEPEKKRPHAMPRQTCEGNTKMGI